MTDTEQHLLHHTLLNIRFALTLEPKPRGFYVCNEVAERMKAFGYPDGNVFDDWALDWCMRQTPPVEAGGDLKALCWREGILPLLPTYWTKGIENITAEEATALRIRMLDEAIEHFKVKES